MKNYGMTLSFNHRSHFSLCGTVYSNGSRFNIEDVCDILTIMKLADHTTELEGENNNATLLVQLL
ncbi:hypothetical protein TSUD_272910 [Trifolium subterraneum]|uniref:Uncharacterized protein n=1 Tax=Trifolium subterraneum TaxID=3900 RepID=A0A2Z6PGC9_TRISU|nr:hypothetical protein TSUD_272910 [Trifolium subterraneum]